MVTGPALATGQNLLALVRATAHPGSLAESMALGLLAAAAIGAGRDLRRSGRES
ncbi:hypothetical protein [Streptomyces sp. NPDC002550]